ncbi:MAG TPA: hypothetical protein VLT45_24135 [Kofleriaceae bacterium]|nr:hypothetical protein [Kofleriaceae bacterium]
MLSPLRQLSGDVVPGRLGAAVLRCAGSFDLARVDWVADEWAAHGIEYWEEPGDQAGQLTSVFGPAPAVVGAVALADFGSGATISDEALRRRARDAAAVLLALGAVLLVLACLAVTTLPRALVAGGTAVLSFAGAATLGQGLWQATVALPPLMAGLALVAWHEKRPRLALGAPAALLLAVMIRPSVAVLGVGLGVVWLRREWRGWRRIAIAAGIAAVAVAPLVAYNAVHWSSPFPLGQWHANARDSAHVFGAPAGIAGLVVSPARGIVWFAPVVFLARRHRLVLVLQLVAMAAFFKWHGGMAYGPRLLAEATWIAIFAACDARVAWLAPAVAVTIVVGQLGLWRFRVEQWETRRRPETHADAWWDVRDNPIFATLRDEPATIVDSPARAFVHCADGRVTTR